MENLIALRVQFADGSERYFLTWGRIQDPVDPRPVERVVRRCLDRRIQPGQAPVGSIVICDSLAEASASTYFYEGLFTFATRGIAFGEDYQEWVAQMRARMEEGKDIFDCGPAPSKL
jgi:hypothetical protein